MAENVSQTSFSRIEFDEEIALTANNQQTLIIFTNTLNKNLIIDQVIATGETDAEFEVLFSSTTKIKYHTSDQQRTLDIAFPNGILLNQGESVEIQVTHFDTGKTRDFSGTIIMHGASR